LAVFVCKKQLSHRDTESQSFVIVFLSDSVAKICVVALVLDAKDYSGRNAFTKTKG
jgi:hypothetical protein